ncbi:MAG TPA: glutamate racemase [Chthoniobacterales bacterium]|nr:glutamate racemase [Chthoniobacterales bacterium]
MPDRKIISSDQPRDGDPRPIGVFDSGIGGLTVVKALRDVLPNEQIIYLGDTARVPYGSRSPSTVERYSLEIANMLMERDAKLMVVACNTVSSVALPQLEHSLPVQVVGVIRPGAEAAIHESRSRNIGVIGTRATIRSGAYERTLKSIDPLVQVTSRACPLLVPLIEEGLLRDDVTDQIIRRYLEPMLAAGIDTLVLGCTHYPLLARAIQQQLGHSVRVVDSARNCALAVKRLLGEQSLGAPAAATGGLQIALTDRPDNFLGVAKEALQLNIEDVELREVVHAPAL